MELEDSRDYAGATQTTVNLNKHGALQVNQLQSSVNGSLNRSNEVSRGHRFQESQRTISTKNQAINHSFTKVPNTGRGGPTVAVSTTNVRQRKVNRIDAQELNTEYSPADNYFERVSKNLHFEAQNQQDNGRPSQAQANQVSLNKSNLSNKSKTKNNFEMKQILKMNVHHHKMNSQRPANLSSSTNFAG